MPPLRRLKADPVKRNRQLGRQLRAESSDREAAGGGLCPPRGLATRTAVVMGMPPRSVEGGKGHSDNCSLRRLRPRTKSFAFTRVLPRVGGDKWQQAAAASTRSVPQPEPEWSTQGKVGGEQRRPFLFLSDAMGHLD